MGLIQRQIPWVEKPPVAQLDESHPLYKYITFATYDGIPRDIGPNQLATIPTGVLTQTPDKYGSSASYPNDAYSSFGALPVLSWNRPFTVSFRVRKPTSRISRFLTLANGTGTPFTCLLYTDGGYAPVAFGGVAGSGVGPSTGDGFELPIGVWVDVSLSYNGSGYVGRTSTANWQIFYNGVSDDVVGQLAMAASDDANWVGRVGTNFFGNIDTSYVVVLDGIEAADLLATPEQALELLQPLTRHIPVGIATAPTPGVTATLSANPSGLPDTDEQVIRDLSAVQWLLTIAGAQWVNPITDTIKGDIIDGLQDTSSAVNDIEWEKVRAAMRADLTNSVALMGATEILLQLPQVLTYDIIAPGSILAVVPSSAYEPLP